MREAELARQKQFETEAADYWNKTTDAMTADKYADDKDAEEGEICIALDQRPAALMRGYQQGDGSIASIAGEVYRTGDVAVRHIPVDGPRGEPEMIAGGASLAPRR